MPTNEERIATLEVEIKLLKWLIPSAAGFLLLCLTIFFAVELKTLNERVKAVIEQSALAPATKRVAELEAAAKQSADGATRFAASAADASSKINKLSSNTDAFAEHLGIPAIRAELEKRVSFGVPIVIHLLKNGKVLSVSAPGIANDGTPVVQHFPHTPIGEHQVFTIERKPK